jgi:hypothetical protein
MHTMSNTQSSVVLCLLAVLVVGGLITNGFALMSSHKLHSESSASHL